MKYKVLSIIALLLAIIMFPVLGFGQSLYHQNEQNDSTQISPLFVQGNEFLMAESVSVPMGSNTILGSIQDTLNIIADITTKSSKKKFIGMESDKANNGISLLAMFFGFFAMLFAGAGYWYQKKSANSLKKIEDKRLPYMTFARSIFERILILDIMSEIEYSSSTEEEKIERRNGYQVDKAMDRLRMPDDLVDLKSYESFTGDEIYSYAMKLKVSWRNYNRYVDDLLSYYRTGERQQLLKMYRTIRKKSISLFYELVDFENMIRGEKDRLFHYEEGERSESAEKKEKRLSVNNYIPDTPVGAEKRFVYQLLCEYAEFDFKGTPRMIYDSRKLYYDVNSIKLDLSFPMSDFRYEIVRRFLIPGENSVLKTQWINGKFVVTNRWGNAISGVKRQIGNALIKCMKNKHVPEYDRLFNLLVSSMWMSADEQQSRYFRRRRTNLVFADSKENGFECDFLHTKHDLISYYATCVLNRIPMNYIVLMKQVFAFEMSKIRCSMIDDEMFYQSEMKKFNEFKDDSVFFVASKQRDCYESLRGLLMFIVAEQRTDFYLEDLNAWVPLSGVHSDHIPCTSLYPLLKELKVVDGDGNVMIKNNSELNDVVNNVIPSFIYNRPMNSPLFYENMKYWAVKKYGKSPFGTMFIKECEKHRATRIFDVLKKYPEGARDSVSLMAQRDGFDRKNEPQTSILAIVDALNELLRQDGHYYLDYSANDTNEKKMIYDCEFILKKNHHTTQDSKAKVFSQEKGMIDARFEGYAKGCVCIYTMVDGMGNDAGTIVVEPNNHVRMATEEEISLNEKLSMRKIKI